MKSTLLALAALTAACASVPDGPVPQPLPETLAWVRAEAPAPRVFLGLETRENVSGGFESLEVGRGVKVTRVVENSPAAEAGLRSGDVVLRLAGTAIDDPDSLEVLLAEARPGTEARLEVRRGDTVFDVPVRLVEGATPRSADEVRPLWLEDPARTLAAWGDAQDGAVLVSAVAGGPCARADLAPGVVVHAIDGERVLTARGLLRQVQRRDPGTEVALELTRPGGERTTAELRLFAPGRTVTRASIPILGGWRADPVRDEASFVLLDLWFLSLFRYERLGEERHWSVLRFFRFATGVGELSE